MQQNALFWNKKNPKFSGEGHSTLNRPVPSGKGDVHPFPTPLPSRRRRRLDSRAFGAQPPSPLFTTRPSQLFAVAGIFGVGPVSTSPQLLPCTVTRLNFELRCMQYVCQRRSNITYHVARLAYLNVHGIVCDFTFIFA